MKTTLLTLLATLVLSIGHAQDRNKPVNFEVMGNCDMCKSRIERTAVKLKGVKTATWNPQTKEFKAIMDERKCSIEDIKKSIAEVGHDSEGFTAPQEVYDQLPECCKYRDPNSMHMEHGEH